MTDPKSLKPGLRPNAPSLKPARVARPGAPAGHPGTRPAGPAPGARSGGSGATGKVVHDERGNAVWEWLAQTSRLAMNATSRLLRRLEAPELKMEDTQDEELRIAPEPSTGGGYDPYNQAVKPPKGGRK